MVKRSVFLVALICALALAGTVQAQVNATLVLRSGEKFTGQLVDLGGIGLTFRYGGTDRQFPPGDIAMIAFEGAPERALTSDDIRNLNDGQHVIVFRDGRVVVGHFVDVGERNPLRITVQTPTETINYRSNEIWRIYMAVPPGSAASTTAATPAQPSVTGALVVPSTQQWVPSGLTVRQGRVYQITATGEVQLSADPNDKAAPAGSLTGRRAPGSPLPGDLAGALIGRIGDGEPFGIGNLTSLKMPGSGPLYLGINDDSLGDNRGHFEVVIKSPTRR